MRSGLPSESGIVFAKYLTFSTAASVSASRGFASLIPVGVDPVGCPAPVGSEPGPAEDRNPEPPAGHLEHRFLPDSGRNIGRFRAHPGRHFHHLRSHSINLNSNRRATISCALFSPMHNIWYFS